MTASRLLFGIILLFHVHTAFAADSLSRRDGSNIIYYLQPSEEGRPTDTLLVVLQGSDCNSVQQISSIFSDFHKVWPGADLLTVEKRGIDSSLPYSAEGERPDCPGEYLQQNTPRRQAEDVRLAIERVREQHNYRQTILLGGSEGAVVASMVAAATPNISASIAFNGGGRWFIDEVLHSMEKNIPDELERQKAVQGFKSFADRVVTGDPFETSMSGHGYLWWRDVLQTDYQAILAEIDSPLLILQSSQDRNVNPELAIDMVQTLRAQGSSNIELITLPELDHFLKDKDGEDKKSLVVRKMRLWLEKTLQAEVQD